MADAVGASKFGTMFAEVQLGYGLEFFTLASVQNSFVDANRNVGQWVGEKTFHLYSLLSTWLSRLFTLVTFFCALS